MSEKENRTLNRDISSILESSSLKKVILFSDKNYSVTFDAAAERSKKLAYTFTPYKFRNLDGLGFGEKFLLSRGYDVVALKCQNDSWFQGLPPELLQSLGHFSEQYEEVLTYGSSMGGYGAIAFSKALKATMVIAISPQYAIDEIFDTRWASEALAIPHWHYRIDTDSLANASYVLIYDNKFAKDLAQVDQLREVLLDKDLVELKVPFSGHPSGRFLADIGVLSDVIDCILDKKNYRLPKYSWSKLRQSANFLFSLGQHAEGENRLSLAVLCYKNCIAIDPGFLEARNRLSSCLWGKGLYKEAITQAEKLTELSPETAIFQNRLSEYLGSVGQLEAATEHAKLAVSLAPRNATFRMHLCTLLNRTGHHLAAIEEARKAVRLAPRNAKYNMHISTLLNRSGDLTGAIAHAKNAAGLARDNAHINLHLSALLAKSGDLENAMHFALIAIQLAPKNAKIANHLSAIRKMKTESAKIITP